MLLRKKATSLLFKEPLFWNFCHTTKSISQLMQGPPRIVQRTVRNIEKASSHTHSFHKPWPVSSAGIWDSAETDKLLLSRSPHPSRMWTPLHHCENKLRIATGAGLLLVTANVYFSCITLFHLRHKPRRWVLLLPWLTDEEAETQKGLKATQLVTGDSRI